MALIPPALPSSKVALCFHPAQFPQAQYGEMKES
jgi:hypothetical protein